MEDDGTFKCTEAFLKFSPMTLERGQRWVDAAMARAGRTPAGDPLPNDEPHR